jgi:alkylated DNA repair protein (DNA oxidative demethylase)
MSDLFDPIVPLTLPREVMAEGALLLRGAALPFEADILTAIQAITAMSPFRHMVTPGGFVMSVAMTNCGAAGWVTDRSGYRYDALDPESGKRAQFRESDRVGFIRSSRDLPVRGPKAQ